MAANTRKPTAVDPELIPSDPGLELWRNAEPGTVAINCLGEYGRKRVELVKGGRTFTITPQERRMNQNACALPELDMFTNGTLQPVNLLDDEPDTPSLRQNPNVFDEADIAKVFKLRGEAFADRIAQVTNPVAFDRLADMARDPRYNATIQQYEQIKARQRLLTADVTDVGGTTDTTERKPRAVTPR